MGAYEEHGLTMEDAKDNDESLLQVMKAVEDAEITITKQMEENNRLKNELLQKTQELERYRLEATSFRPLHDHTIDPSKMHLSNLADNEAERNQYSLKAHSMLVVHQERVNTSEEPSAQTSVVDQHFSLNNKLKEALQRTPKAQSGTDNVVPSQFSPSSSRSLSPNRHQKDIENEAGFIFSRNSLIPMSEELISKVRKQEEEIAQLRRHLADYSVKEAQIQNEKYVLEKRISYMRMAFDQQQQDLVDAASKAISYRQEILEENIRLTYALQAAQAEKSTFVSSLLPLLSEYGLEPSVLDAQSIASNIKVLFRHMQEKLLIAEEKLKESEYQLVPLHVESSNVEGLHPQSSNHPPENKSRLDIVPLPPYLHYQPVVSSDPDTQTRLDMEIPRNKNQHRGSTDIAGQNLDHHNSERASPSIRNFIGKEVLVPPSQVNSHFSHVGDESKGPNSSFKELVEVGKSDYAETPTIQCEREPPLLWASENSSIIATGNDDPSYYPHLPPVLEEPVSSLSEATEDDPLPAIEGLRISGEAIPGKELQASGYSINGTTACNFEWVRYLEDGSVQYVDGARQPTYLVTADDVDSYLAIEVLPLDKRRRKGGLVKVFANEQIKITCAPEMQEQIKKDLSAGHVSYEVSFSIRYMDLWEPAVLAIKKEGYSIKCNSSRGVVVSEKFKPATIITIPFGHPTEFSIQDACGEFLLKSDVGSQMRDTIVLTMRGFKLMASEKKKARRKVLFFK